VNRAIPEALQRRKEDADEIATESESNASLLDSYIERYFIISL
jgi:hypothetical protein